MSDTNYEDDDDISWGQTLRNYATSIGTDIATLPTTAAAIPQYLWSGAKALYNTYGTDEKFLQEFNKQNMIEGAQKNITDHLMTIKQTWHEREPDVSEEELNNNLDNYMKSKEFEDFTHSQLSGAVWADTKAKDFLRNLAGDTRTAEERPMGEDIASIIGTAGIGTSVRAPAVIANLAGKSAAAAAIFNNPISRTAIKAAELTTPVTIPYTPLNVAANAAVGVAMHQGFQYATGQPTLLSGDDDSSTVGAIAATAGGIAAVTGLAMAMRGHNAALIRDAVRSDSAKALAGDLPLDLAVQPTARSGEASIIGGPKQQVNPPEYREELPAATGAWRWFKEKTIDEFNNPIAATRDLIGRPEANFVEQVYRSHAGSVMNDRRRPWVTTIMHEPNQAYYAMDNIDRRAADEGVNALNYKAEYDNIVDTHQETINKLKVALTKTGITPQAKSAITRDLAKEQEQLANFLDPAHIPSRHMHPQLDPRRIIGYAEKFLADDTPQMVRFKDSFRSAVSKVYDQLVLSGRMTREEADVRLAKAPYYVPPFADPLNGATGLKRVMDSVLYSSRQFFASHVQDISTVRRETPLGRLPHEVPNVNPTGKDRETRITAQMGPMSALKKFADNTYADSSYTHMRNQILNTWMYKDGLNLPGNETRMLLGNHLEIVKNPKDPNRTWHFAHEKGTDWASKLFDEDNIVPIWNKGHFQLVRLGDKEWARMLRHEPQLMHGMAVAFAIPAKINKFFTTSYGAPWWAFTGSGYDLSVGTFTVKPGRAFGPLSSVMRKYTPTLAKVFDYFPDLTSPLGALWYIPKAFIELQATAAARTAADMISSSHPALGVMRKVMGEQNFVAATKSALKIAQGSHEMATIQLLNRGATHGYNATIDSTIKVRDHYSWLTDKVPGPLKAIVNFYKNGVDAIYSWPKIMFYTQNMGLAYRKYGPNVPESVIEQLAHEARTLGGDMTIRPASIFIRDVEAAVPYSAQVKLGTYHLMRQMFSKETYWYVLPRLTFTAMLYGQGLLWRTYWNEESRTDLWERTPGYDRYRYIYFPKWDLINAHFNGGTLPFSRDLFFKLPIAPDFTPITAGAAAFMQAVGMLPDGSVAKNKPLHMEWMGATLSSLWPSMPPLAQAGLALNNMSLDPQTADVRSGNWIRSFSNPYRTGPQAESATPLGEVTMSQSLFMRALFGTLGNYMAVALDQGLHAMKFDTNAHGVPTEKQAYDFNKGLNIATNEVFERVKERIPDIPMLWTGSERMVTMTPAWEYVGEATGHMRSIASMRNNVTGKKAQLVAAMRTASGGVRDKILMNLTLIQVADDIARYQNPTGEFGQLKEQYNQIGNIDRGVVNNYKIPREERQRRHNNYVKLLQNNLMQRHMSINYLEQLIEQKYGEKLLPLMKGRGITMQSLDAVMRENLGVPATPQPGAAQAQDEEG